MKWIERYKIRIEYILKDARNFNDHSLQLLKQARDNAKIESKQELENAYKQVLSN